VGVRFRRTGGEGVATLAVGGEPCGEVAIPLVMRVISSVGASVGLDHGSAVSDRYRAPFPFAGLLERLDVQLVSPHPTDAAAATARALMSRQ